MQIVEIDTANKSQIDQFLALPFRIYADIPQWVPPMEADARLALNRRRHPFFRHSEAAFFLAYDEKGLPVGRLAVLNNRNHNQFNRESTAFFYLFECEDDPQAATCLFESAFQWARSQQLDKMIGPKGFTVLDGLGMLVKGFEHRPAFGLPYNLPYYPRLLETVGFQPAGELVSGYLNRNIVLPQRIHQVADLLKERRGFRVARFKSRRELLSFVPKLKELYNGALGSTTGNTPLSDDEVKILADQLIWFADPRLVKIIYKGEQPVGFLLAYPDISAAVQRTRGRIFPFGWIDLLFELKRTRWININGAGMIEGFRGLGGTALLFSEMYKSVIEDRYEHADLVQIGTENDRMLRELSDLGIDFYKVHRMYSREI